MIDSVYRKDENYCPKVFLEKHNFNDDIEYSDEEYSDEKIQMNKIQLKKIKCIDAYLETRENFFRNIR